MNKYLIIPIDQHANVMSSFWTMLQECESKAAKENDPILKRWVEQWYTQWNTLTGQSHSPSWNTYKTHKKL